MTWTLAALIVFLILPACIVLARLLSAPLFQITLKKPPQVRINEPLARADREARQFADWKKPTLTQPAKKGIDRARLDRVAHLGDRRSVQR